METIRKKIADCTRDELLWFANKVKGLSLSPNLPNKEAIVAKIQAVHHEDEIEVLAPAAAPNMAGTPPSSGAKLKTKAAVPMVTLTLALHDRDPSGKRPLELVFQNRAFLIPRGVQCKVPWYFFEILRNAITDVATPQKDDNGNFIMGAGPLMTPMPAHGFSVTQMPDRKEVQAYFDAVGGRWDEGLDAWYQKQTVLEPVAA